MIRIRFADAPDQRFSAVVNGRRMTFRFRYNMSSEFWSVDIHIDGIEKILARRITEGVNEFYFDFFNGAILVKGTLTRRSLPSGNTPVYIVSREEINAAMAA